MITWDDLTVIVFDTEYISRPGERPILTCLAALELRTGRTWQFWCEELASMTTAPFPSGPGAVWVVFGGTGDCQCIQELGWKPPYVIDIYSEYSAITNGLRQEHSPDDEQKTKEGKRKRKSNRSLLHALKKYGIPSMGEDAKEEARLMVLSGGPWDSAQRKHILDYCLDDVRLTGRLLERMREEGDLDLPAALWRGRYVPCAAAMESYGIPIDVPTHTLLAENWGTIQQGLIRTVDVNYNVFDEAGSFKLDRFGSYLKSQGISWPRTPSGRLATDKDTFRGQSQSYPELIQLQQLRQTLGQMRLSDLPVGADGRSRCWLGQFGAKTSRNTPSSSQFPLGLAAWLRSLIKPSEGMAIAYVDYEQQEYAIAACYSGDGAMLAAYESGDPYMTMAIQCGAAPPGATKQTHGAVRDRFKTLALAIQYQAGPYTVAMRMGVAECVAREYLAWHHKAYRYLWRWSDGVFNSALIRGKLMTCFRWPLFITRQTKERTIRNFPCQGNGAEMLRLAICLAAESGVKVIAPCHDAVLIEAPSNEIDDAVRQTQWAMAKASSDVLNGMRLRSEAKITRFPDRFVDPRGTALWSQVTGQLLTA